MNYFYPIKESILLPEETSSGFKVFSPRYFQINPLERIELGLGFIWALRFVRESVIFEIKYSLTFKKGIILLNHNLNQAKPGEELKVILYNSNWAAPQNAHSLIFGNRNRVEVQKDEGIGFIYLKEKV